MGGCDTTMGGTMGVAMIAYQFRLLIKSSKVTMQHLQRKSCSGKTSCAAMLSMEVAHIATEKNSEP